MNKRAIVTGASSGIGAAITKALCLQDVEVYAVARNEEKLKKIKASLPAEKQKYFKITIADISNSTGIKNILKAAHPTNNVDLLINNAGTGISKPLDEHNNHEIDRVIATNLTGAIKLTAGVLKNRSKKSKLRIIFVSSMAGRIGFPNLSVYSASKFGLEGFVESLRYEYRFQNVKISILLPGVTDTNFFKIAKINKPEKIHTPDHVAKVLLNKINKSLIVVGGDKYFIKIIHFIPFHYRFKVMSITDKLPRRDR
jgi:short-subunit dehydrogenase